MFSYLRLFSLNLISEGESVNEFDVRDRDLCIRLRRLKEEVRSIKDVTKISTLGQFLFGTIHKDKIYRVLIEDDFFQWLIESIVEGGVDLPYTKKVLSFLISSISINMKYLMKVASCSNLIDVIKILSKMNNFKITVKLILIIYAISLEYETTIFRDEEIKTFLLCHASSEVGSLCVAILVKLMTKEEIASQQALLYSCIDDIIKDLDRFCHFLPLSSSYITLSENIKILKGLCKLEYVRKKISQNFKLFFDLRRILKEPIFIMHVNEVKPLLWQLYSEEQINHIEADIGSRIY